MENDTTPAVLMFYRLSEKLREANPEHSMRRWQSWVINDDVSAKSDGVTYDLVKEYQARTTDMPNPTDDVNQSFTWTEVPTFEVRLVDIEFPKND